MNDWPLEVFDDDVFLNLFEQALQAPTMEAVIALSERVQTLEAKPKASFTPPIAPSIKPS